MILPAYMTATLSQVSATTAKSWETSTSDMPVRSWSSINRARIWS